jgi:hypothetical protein
MERCGFGQLSRWNSLEIHGHIYILKLMEQKLFIVNQYPFNVAENPR